jgi:uncharacterized delta-60 repeat protein
LAGGFFIGQWLLDGDLDTSFGAGGIEIVDFPGPAAGAFDVALDSEQRLVVAGYATETVGGASGVEDDHFAIARILPGGALDPSFDGDGLLITDVPAGVGDRAYAVKMQPDGKILVAGVTGDLMVIVRYLPDGFLDVPFGTAGWIVIQDWRFLSEDGATDLELQPDGSILLVATSQEHDVVVARILSTGIPDPAFGDSTAGGGGFRGFEFGGTGSVDTASAVALQSDGKIVVGGWFHDGDESHSRFALARLMPDGRALDAQFDGDGIRDFGFYASQGAYLHDLAITNEGILAAGYTMAPSASGAHSQFALARLKANGTFDQEFGQSGRTTADFFTENSNLDVARSMAVLPDGRILLAGHSISPRPDAIGGSAVARFFGLFPPSFLHHH